MWFRRVRFIDIRYHWSWRKCTIVLVILLIINTAFHWTLVDDVNSHTGQPDHQIAIAQSKGDDGPLFHDRVLSINKWFDDKSGGDDEEKGLAFEAVNDHQAQQKEAHREPLITYITRKPSNRKPLGEALTKRRDHVTELLLERSENPEPEKFGNASPSSLDIVQNKSEMSIKVSESRKQIAHMREKLQTRKREVIKNKSVETREVVLPFLQNPQTKIRQATKLKINNEHERATKVIDTIQTIDLFAIVDIYSNEKIRYYSQPIWLNSEDISVMNLLAGSWILCRRPDPDLTSASDPSNPHLLLIANSEMGRMVDKLDDNGRKQGGKFDPDTGCDQAESTGCRTAWCSFDLSVVVAFHLDRVIGLNITPPSVARELPVGTRHPTAPLHAGGPSEPLRSKFVLDADLAVRTVALVVTSLDGANARRHAGLSETRDGDRGDSRKLTPATATTAEFSEELSEKLIIFCYLLKVDDLLKNPCWAWNTIV